MRGKRGRKRCFGGAVGGVSVRKIPNPRRDLAESGEFTAISICRERSSPSRFAKNSFGGCFSASLSGSSGVFENQCPAVVQLDFLGFPCLALVVAIWIGIGWIPGTVEPVKIGFFVGDPFLDRLPGRFDRLHGLDVKGRRWRALERDDSLPEAVEAEKKLSTLSRTPYQSAFGIQEMLTEVSNEYSISSRRMTLRTGFMVPLQQGHSRGSPPQTLRIRSRHSGRMSRADCFGGAGTRRISAGGVSGGRSVFGGRMMRSGMRGCWPRVLLE